MVAFEEGIDKFLQYLHVVKQASSHTLRNYSLDLVGFNKFLVKEMQKEPDLEEVDKRLIRAFLASLAAQGAAKKTVLRRLSSLRSLYAYLMREKLIALNPLEEIDSPKLDKKIPPSFAYEQVLCFFEQPDTTSYLGLRDRAIMELFYSSGLRLSELAGLNKEEIDFIQLRIRVMGKGKKQRVVPVTKTAIEWILKYLHAPERHIDSDAYQKEVDTKALFLNKWGRRLSVRSIDRQFKQYLQASGLMGRITPHTIRHTIATHWLEKGMDLKTIQVLLGHCSLATTTIYTQVSSRLKREVYTKAHPLENVLLKK